MLMAAGRVASRRVAPQGMTVRRLAGAAPRAVAWRGVACMERSAGAIPGYSRGEAGRGEEGRVTRSDTL